MFSTKIFNISIVDSKNTNVKNEEGLLGIAWYSGGVTLH